MWIVFRLAVALFAFVARYAWLAWPPERAGIHDGEPWYRKLKSVGRRENERIEGFRVGVAMHSPVVFRLQHEGRTDRFLKWLGLAHEFQTGDTQFDREVYIACDHPALHLALKERPEARAAVIDALSAGFHRISSDGRVLWIERKSDIEPSLADVDRVARLRAAIGPLRTRLISDAYDARVVAVEALTWSIFAYALAAVVDVYVPVDTYLDPGSLLWPGIAVGAGILLGTAALVVLLLRNSSRGARILVEAAILLVLSAPIAGIQLLADANRTLDFSEPLATTWHVTGWRTETPRRAPRIRYVTFEAEDSAALGKSFVELVVPESIYQAARRGSRTFISVGRGAFGYPWIRRMEIVPR